MLLTIISAATIKRNASTSKKRIGYFFWLEKNYWASLKNFEPELRSSAVAKRKSAVFRTWYLFSFQSMKRNEL